MPRALGVLLVLIAASQAERPRAVDLEIRYRAVSEDDAPTGSLLLRAATDRPRHATVWEHGCRVTGASERDRPPGDADQYWTFAATLEYQENVPQIRVRYRTVVPGSADEAPEHVMLFAGTKGVRPGVIEALSRRTDCRYDRVRITVVPR